jgi:membrane associated rhomboid family serine protease
MGLENRDYYRESSPAGSAVQSMVVKLIIVNGVLWLANAFFGGSGQVITRALMLQNDALAHPWMWYQFLTAGFVHDWNNPLHVAGNMLGLFVFGRPLEERYGSREFLRFYLTAIVVSLLAWGVRNYFFVGPNTPGSCLGASGGVTATIILFCLVEPRATVFAPFPIPAWIFGILIVATDILGSQPAALGTRVAHDAHLAGAAFGVAYWRFRWNFGRLPGLAWISRLLQKPQRWMQPRPPLKVHDPEQYYEDLDAEGDRLLIKVQEQGLESLTPQERQQLEAYSRRTRQKLR